MTAEFCEGVRLFNSQRYFEAHEALEAIWLKAHGEEKLFLHGLIQVAAAFHHFTRKNQAGFKSLLEKGCAKLRKSGDAMDRINLPDFLRQLEPWQEMLARGEAVTAENVPRLPKINPAPSDRSRG